MESKVADAARAALRLREQQMLPGERVLRALALGRRGCELLAAARGSSLKEARREAKAAVAAARRAG